MTNYARDMSPEDRKERRRIYRNRNRATKEGRLKYNASQRVINKRRRARLKAERDERENSSVISFLSLRLREDA